jgi:hypothetical protein
MFYFYSFCHFIFIFIIIYSSLLMPLSIQFLFPHYFLSLLLLTFYFTFYILWCSFSRLCWFVCLLLVLYFVFLLSFFSSFRFCVFTVMCLFSQKPFDILNNFQVEEVKRRQEERPSQICKELDAPKTSSRATSTSHQNMFLICDDLRCKYVFLSILFFPLSHRTAFLSFL